MQRHPICVEGTTSPAPSGRPASTGPASTTSAIPTTTTTAAAALSFPHRARSRRREGRPTALPRPPVRSSPRVAVQSRRRSQDDNGLQPVTSMHACYITLNRIFVRPSFLLVRVIFLGTQLSTCSSNSTPSSPPPSTFSSRYRQRPPLFTLSEAMFLYPVSIQTLYHRSQVTLTLSRSQTKLDFPHFSLHAGVCS